MTSDTHASRSTARRIDFGALNDGRPVEAVELSNVGGVSVRILTLGATIQALSAPDSRGACADVVLGYNTAAEYLAQPQFFGATVGRYANRIARGQFSLDGATYTLAVNDGPNHLHGGKVGFDKVLWTLESITSGSPARVTMSYRSRNGEEGYPGTLTARATYTLSDDNELAIDYVATTDRATIVNITNHSYFNLAGEASTAGILDHRLLIAADTFTPVDATSIPTGKLLPVTDTAFDFRRPTRIGERIDEPDNAQLRIARGYDHNFVVNGQRGTRRVAARLEDPASGRVMEVATTAPGLQFYSGNLLDGTTNGKSGRLYRKHDALCLEPQTFPDSPNQSHFPSARLDPGVEYSHSITLRFSTVS